jgi:hypothetical protein
MVKLRNGLAAIAALGLVAAGPASAATRAAQALPAASTQFVGVAPARATQPMTQASALANEDDDNPTALIVGLVVLLLAILLAASGGGGGAGGPDSPG